MGARLHVRTLPAVLLGALGSFPAFAQAPAAEISQHDTPATFSTRVNLVSVPVVVRDRQGHAIGTLRQEDFQLFDKGKPQVITKFSVEKSGSSSLQAVTARDGNAVEVLDPQTGAAPGSVLPERFVAYLFDDVHLTAEDLSRVRLATAKHLSKTLESTSRAAIFTTSGMISLDFTDDQQKLRETLNRIQPSSSPLVPGQDCPDVSYFQADAIQNKNDTVALQVATDDSIVCSGITGTTQAQTIALNQTNAQAQAMRVLRLGEAESNRVLQILQDLIRRMSASPGSRSIVLISPGFFLTADYFVNETDLIDRAIRANVTISALDARGLYVTIPGGNASQRSSFNAPSGALKASYEQQMASVNADVLAELSFNTGGTFFHNDNGLEEGLDKVATRPEYIYILGFSPQNLKYDGSYHALKVSLTKSKSDLDLQSRRGYYAPKHPADPQEEAREEIREAVFSRDEMREINVDLNMQFFKTSDVKAQLSVLARIDLKHLHYRKADERNKNSLTIVSGLFDRNGNFVNGIQKVVDLNLKDQTLEAVPDSGITVRTNFDVAPGGYVIRLVVRDSEGQTMAARNGVVQIP